MVTAKERRRSKKRDPKKGWKKAMFLFDEAARMARSRMRNHETTFTEAGINPARVRASQVPVAAEPGIRPGWLASEDPYATAAQAAFERAMVRDGGGRAWEHPEHFVTAGGLMPCEAQRYYPEGGLRGKR